MKKTLIVALMMLAGIAHAAKPGCYDGAFKFAEFLNNMHKIGYSRNLIESKLKDVGMSPDIIAVGNRYTGILFNTAKGGWTNSEYQTFASTFANSACK
jgi:hypothetical protein